MMYTTIMVDNIVLPAFDLLFHFTKKAEHCTELNHKDYEENVEDVIFKPFCILNHPSVDRGLDTGQLVMMDLRWLDASNVNLRLTSGRGMAHFRVLPLK